MQTFSPLQVNQLPRMLRLLVLSDITTTTITTVDSISSVWHLRLHLHIRQGYYNCFSKYRLFEVAALVIIHYCRPACVHVYMCTCILACVHTRFTNPPSPKRHIGALFVGPFMGVFWALCHGHGHLMAVLVLRGHLMCFDLGGVGFCAHTWFTVQGLSFRADMRTKRKANSEQVYELEATCRARSCALF